MAGDFDIEKEFEIAPVFGLEELPLEVALLADDLSVYVQGRGLLQAMALANVEGFVPCVCEGFHCRVFIDHSFDTPVDAARIAALAIAAAITGNIPIKR